MIQASILPLLTGAAVGMLFAYLKLPIPAPPTMPGVAGVVGVWLGFEIVRLLVK